MKKTLHNRLKKDIYETILRETIWGSVVLDELKHIYDFYDLSADSLSHISKHANLGKNYPIKELESILFEKP